MHDPDRDASLRAAVLASPEDDLPRLVYADFLDETAGVVVCRWCEGVGFLKCATCHVKPTKTGKLRGHRRDCLGLRKEARVCPNCHHGWASDGRAERAEFIRCQVRASAHDSSYYLSFATHHYHAKSALPDVVRAAELLHFAWGEELRGLGAKDPTLFNSWEFCRGFPWRVVAPLRDLWGPEARLSFWRSLYPIERAKPFGIDPCKLSDGWMFCRNFGETVRPWDGYGLPPSLFDRLTGHYRLSNTPDAGHYPVRESKVYHHKADALNALEEALSHGLLP